MIVTGIRPYTTIRQTQSFVGNKNKKDAPDNKEILFKKTDLEAFEKKLIEVRNNPDFLRRLRKLKAETEAEIEERRLSSIVPPDKLRELITI